MGYASLARNALMLPLQFLSGYYLFGCQTVLYLFKIHTMQLFSLRMHLAALRQLLRDRSEEMTEDQRLEIWNKIEALQDLIEKLESLND
jgi:hypothetical protein